MASTTRSPAIRPTATQLVTDLFSYTLVPRHERWQSDVPVIYISPTFVELECGCVC
ncbi:hypothetical protein M413DRAFT_447756 [Hebeloma cylindrosporum]|uniref:Uncharacterized protein n=1 Tax=Hebeloma cylindrosporum TaxID=76867 RepID=A0A0C2YC01_HEBCY|nr:hypothetical protein M413DRAFT_447756 [Hebeloma cylindrosporum h7]